ncbi:hypothetical protein THAOC_35100, partial [Thalassiosira oceanica]
MLSAPAQKKAKIGGGETTGAEVFFLYEGGEIADELKSKLKRVRVGQRVTRIPDGAFSDCSNLAEVHFHEGLLAIGVGAFHKCTALRSVDIPSTVTELSYAFAGCSNLAKVHLNEGLLIVGDMAFQSCWALRSVTIPSTVTGLGNGTFINCRNLAEVKLNDGLVTVGRGAFAGCCALRSVTIPSSITMLGQYTFQGCSKLIEVQLNEGLKIISEGAFDGCTALQSVTIPSTVRVAVEQAFYRCYNLSEVILLGGQRFLNEKFLARRLSDEEGILKHQMIGITFEGSAFNNCPLTQVKISISWAVSERIARLTPQCRLSVEERIRNLPRLELLQDGTVSACFPFSGESDDEAGDDFDAEEGDIFDVQDT